MAVPSDQNMSLNEFQKVSKYRDLEIEVTKMWKLKTKVIPVVIGALGMIKNGKKKNSLMKYLVSPLYKKCKKLYLLVPLTYSEKYSQSKTTSIKKVHSSSSASGLRLKACQMILSKQHLKELIIITIIIIIIIMIVINK